MTRLLSLSLLALAVGAVSCKGTYKDPFGGEFEWEYPDNPSPEDAQEAFDALEGALDTNLEAQQQGLANGDAAMFDLATSNIASITEAKLDLAGKSRAGSSTGTSTSSA